MENEKKTAAMKEAETRDPVGSSVSGFLYQFMENHAPLFWVIFSFGMVLIVYKSFNLAFLNKTPYTWDDAFQHLTLALICILMEPTIPVLSADHILSYVCMALMTTSIPSVSPQPMDTPPVTASSVERKAASVLSARSTISCARR